MGVWDALKKEPLTGLHSGSVGATDVSWKPTEPADVDAASASWPNVELRWELSRSKEQSESRRELALSKPLSVNLNFVERRGQRAPRS